MMRKAVISVLVVALVAGLVAAPASAGKKKTKKEDWSMTGRPLPILSDASDTGCLEGQEGIHKTTHPFTTPGSGILEARIDNFQGDWDLYVVDENGVLAASDTSQLQGSPPQELILLPLKKGTDVAIVACNWAGGPTAEGHLVYTYK
jgi:hypothetical protein